MYATYMMWYAAITCVNKVTETSLLVQLGEQDLRNRLLAWHETMKKYWRCWIFITWAWIWRGCRNKL